MRCQEFVEGFLKFLDGRHADLLETIRSEAQISDATDETLQKAIGEFKAEWSRETEPAT